MEKVRDIEKLNETLELTLPTKEDDREEAVIVNKIKNKIEYSQGTLQIG